MASILKLKGTGSVISGWFPNRIPKKGMAMVKEKSEKNTERAMQIKYRAIFFLYGNKYRIIL